MTDSGSIHISTNDPFHSFRWLSNILLYLCTTSSLFILHLKTDPEFWIHSKQVPAAQAPFHCFPQSVPLWVKQAETLVQFSCSVVSDSATPWIAARRASLSITNSRSLLKPMFIESVMPSSHLILCRPLLLLPSIPPSIRVFSNESTLRMRWLKYWSFSFSISPSNETQDWPPLGWTGWISLQSKGLSRAFSNTTVQKHQFFSAQLSL